MEKKYFTAESVRLARFLYSLGFDKISKYDGTKEFWMFEKTPLLDEALKFYFYFRNKIRSECNDIKKL